MYKAIFIGIAVVLLTLSVVPSQTMTSNASIANNTSGSNSNGSSDFSGAIEHISQAQTALQNGDTEGANNHLELAKQSINPNWEKNEKPYNSGELKPVNPDITVN